MWQDIGRKMVFRPSVTLLCVLRVTCGHVHVLMSLPEPARGEILATEVWCPEWSFLPETTKTLNWLWFVLMGWYTLRFCLVFLTMSGSFDPNMLNMLMLMFWFILSMSALCQGSAPARRAAASAVKTLGNRLDTWTEVSQCWTCFYHVLSILFVSIYLYHSSSFYDILCMILL